MMSFFPGVKAGFIASMSAMVRTSKIFASSAPGRGNWRGREPVQIISFEKASSLWSSNVTVLSSVEIAVARQPSLSVTFSLS